MTASRYDFSIEQGSSFRMNLIYKNDDGSIIDITNWCARLTWTTNKNVIQVFNTTNLDYSIYKFTITGNEGKISLLIPAETTNSFDFNTAKYDLELQSPDDLYTGGGKYTTRLLYGVITIDKRFSKSGNSLDCIS
jgi:P pilus assembly chaperone PapD